MCASWIISWYLQTKYEHTCDGSIFIVLPPALLSSCTKLVSRQLILLIYILYQLDHWLGPCIVVVLLSKIISCSAAVVAGSCVLNDCATRRSDFVETHIWYAQNLSTTRRGNLLLDQHHPLHHTTTPLRNSHLLTILHKHSLPLLRFLHNRRRKASTTRRSNLLLHQHPLITISHKL